MIVTNKYKTILSLLLLSCLPLNSSASMIYVPDEYSYVVQVLPPFGSVLINDTITCPDQGGASCLVNNQVIGSVMTIIGFKDHACYITINKDGSVTVDQGKSVFCTIQSIPATHTSAGHITLPNHF